MHKLTAALLAVGAVGAGSIVQAEEKQTPLLTALSSTVISGYVDTSAHWNVGSKNGTSSSPIPFSSGKDDGFNLNVIKLTLQRPLDEGEWSAGYRVDLLFGPDAVFYNPSFPDGDADQDTAIKQAYVALRAPVGNGIDFKIGVFDTVIGYEVFEGPNNPNYTRSYGWAIEPTQHTGLLASYQINEYIGVTAGIANTFSPGINRKAHPSGGDVGPKSETYKAYMGSVALTAPDSFGPLAGGTLYAGVVNGFDHATFADRTGWYAGATIPTPVDGLRLGVAFDYSGVSEQTSLGQTSTFFKALALYASYQATEKASLHFRGEYFEASGQQDLAGADVFFPKELVAVTGTFQYDLWANVLSRLEVRWDHALDGKPTSAGGTGGKPFGAEDRNAVLVAANIVYRF